MLAVSPKGDLIAGGNFTTIGSSIVNYVARWNGSAWFPLGSGTNRTVSACAFLPDGDLVTAGSFGTKGSTGIVRWDGSTWSGVATGMWGDPHAFAMLSAGELARPATTCPAAAASYGAGCTGAAGPMVLAATSLPWVGGTCRTVCTGMASSSLGFGLVGLGATNTPLAHLHPAGGTGCSLLARPDSVEHLPPPGNGTVAWQLAIPSTAAFVGVMLRHQVLQLALDPTFQITGLRSSNGLLLTVGAF